MPRVLIVDDHVVIRRGVHGILSTYPEWDMLRRGRQWPRCFATC